MAHPHLSDDASCAFVDVRQLPPGTHAAATTPDPAAIRMQQRAHSNVAFSFSDSMRIKLATIQLKPPPALREAWWSICPLVGKATYGKAVADGKKK